MSEIESARNAAERVMAGVTGETRLGDVTSLNGSDRSTVLRFRVEAGPTGSPHSIIVKRTVDMGADWDDPSDPDSPTIRFFNEWASLQFLGDVGADQPIAPRLYGADRDAGILVMEDLGPVQGFTESLLADDPHAARDDLLTYASTIGRLHARTAGHVARFQDLRDSIGPPNPGFGEAWIASAFHAMLSALEIAPPSGVDAELEVLKARMADPGEFRTFIHADPCPDNWARVGNSDRLVDFEYARVGPALLEGVYGRVPFPTCGCVGRLPEQVTQEMERVYRMELARGCPAALDDALYLSATAEACVFWLILLCHWHPMAVLLEEAREWGTATIRQRLLTRLEVAANATAEAGHLASIGESASAMLLALQRRWVGEIETLPLYPAFRAP